MSEEAPDPAIHLVLGEGLQHPRERVRHHGIELEESGEPHRAVGDAVRPLHMLAVEGDDGATGQGGEQRRIVAPLQVVDAPAVLGEERPHETAYAPAVVGLVKAAHAAHVILPLAQHPRHVRREVGMVEEEVEDGLVAAEGDIAHLAGHRRSLHHVAHELVGVELEPIPRNGARSARFAEGEARILRARRSRAEHQPQRQPGRRDRPRARSHDAPRYHRRLDRPTATLLFSEPREAERSSLQ